MDESTYHSVVEAQINYVLLFGIVLLSHILMLNWEPKIRILISAVKAEAATGLCTALGDTVIFQNKRLNKNELQR